MKPEPLRVAEDRGFIVPANTTVKTGYASIDCVDMICRDRMSVGDVDHAMKRRMAASPGQPWPCPNGYWEADRFKIMDGRHEYVAALMLGCEYILVAWIDNG